MSRPGANLTVYRAGCVEYTQGRCSFVPTIEHTVLCCAVLMQQHTSKCEHWEASVCKRQQREVRVPTLQEESVWWYIWASTQDMIIKSPSRWSNAEQLITSKLHASQSKGPVTFILQGQKTADQSMSTEMSLRKQQHVIQNVWRYRSLLRGKQQNNCALQNSSYTRYRKKLKPESFRNVSNVSIQEIRHTNYFSSHWQIFKAT